MSAGAQERDLAELPGKLSREGSISPGQAEMVERLIAEVGALTRGRGRRREAVVRTAVPLTPEEQAQFQALVARRFGPGHQVTFEVDPGVLGGVWLRVDDQIIDDSLRGRLDALRKRMIGAAGRG